MNQDRTPDPDDISWGKKVDSIVTWVRLGFLIQAESMRVAWNKKNPDNTITKADIIPQKRSVS